MGIEIERKFLVDGEAFRNSEEWRHHIVSMTSMYQGYFSSPETLEAGQKASMRVRLEYPSAEEKGSTSWLNIKSVGRGHTRQEFEYPIPTDEAEQLLLLCVGSVVSKVRYCVNYGGHLWEVDCFTNDNDGLWVAEIELTSADFPITLPSWVGAEVTDDLRYTNVALSAHPFNGW